MPPNQERYFLAYSPSLTQALRGRNKGFCDHWGFLLNSNKKKLSSEQRQELLSALRVRFEKNMNRHKGLEWGNVQAKLEGSHDNGGDNKLSSLNEMDS